MDRVVQEFVDDICAEVEKKLTDLGDEDYVDVTEQISCWFDASTEAKREEMKRDAGTGKDR